MEQAPGPTKAVIRIIDESKKRDLKPYEVSSYERALETLNKISPETDSNNIEQIKLKDIKRKRIILHIFSKKLNRNIAIVPDESYFNKIKEGFQPWTVDEVLSIMESGADISTIDVVRTAIDGEVIKNNKEKQIKLNINI